MKIRAAILALSLLALLPVPATAAEVIEKSIETDQVFVSIPHSFFQKSHLHQQYC